MNCVFEWIIIMLIFIGIIGLWGIGKIYNFGAGETMLTIIAIILVAGIGIGFLNIFRMEMKEK